MGDEGSNVVALKVARGGAFELCSAAVLGPNILLTARHCVAKTITTSVSCDENGRSTNGAHVDGNQDPATIAVYASASPKFTREPDAIGKTIIGPESSELCDTDIALIVLDRPLTGIRPLAVRLAARVSAGETVRSIGYGQNDRSSPIGTRFHKPNVAVLAMGSGISRSKTALGLHEFEVGRSICQGDSGGPAISETTGAVIGVVSRGSDCDDDFGHIYTTTTGWPSLFERAFAIAGGAPIAEPPDGLAPAAFASRDAMVDGKDDANGGCSVAALGSRRSSTSTSTSTSRNGLGLLGLGVLAIAIGRRRRDR